MPVSWDGDCVSLRVGGDGEFNVIALALFFFVGDVLVGHVVRGTIGTQVFVELIDGLQRFGVLQRCENL